MDGLEAAETENTVETGNESIVLMLSAYCFCLGNAFNYAGLWQTRNTSFILQYEMCIWADTKEKCPVLFKPILIKAI